MRARNVVVQLGKRSVSGYRFSDAANGDNSERLLAAGACPLRHSG